MGSSDLDLSLDLLARLLRIWAEHPIDVPGRDTRRDLEEWAIHLLTGKPRAGQSGKLSKRDWPGARQFLLQLRREEAAFVRSSHAGMRQTLQGLVERFRNAIEDERALDQQASTKLSKLKAAAAGDDIRALRAAAEEAAEVISRVLTSHRERLEEQESAMSARLAEMGEKLVAAEQLAEEDPLTGLVNRRGFDAELAKAVDLGAHFKSNCALILVDVDRFKTLNDELGHPGGDAALKAVSNALSRTFPRRGDCVARYGGDEFAVILREITPAEAERMAQRFLETLRAVRVQHLQLTASVGVAMLRASENAASWVARTDDAVYAAKSAGRDRLVVAG